MSKTTKKSIAQVIYIKHYYNLVNKEIIVKFWDDFPMTKHQ